MEKGYELRGANLSTDGKGIKVENPARLKVKRKERTKPEETKTTNQVIDISR